MHVGGVRHAPGRARCAAARRGRAQRFRGARGPTPAAGRAAAVQAAAAAPAPAPPPAPGAAQTTRTGRRAGSSGGKSPHRRRCTPRKGQKPSNSRPRPLPAAAGRGRGRWGGLPRSAAGPAPRTPSGPEGRVAAAACYEPGRRGTLLWAVATRSDLGAPGGRNGWRARRLQVTMEHNVCPGAGQRRVCTRTAGDGRGCAAADAPLLRVAGARPKAQLDPTGRRPSTGHVPRCVHHTYAQRGPGSPGAARRRLVGAGSRSTIGGGDTGFEGDPLDTLHCLRSDPAPRPPAAGPASRPSAKQPLPPSPPRAVTRRRPRRRLRRAPLPSPPQSSRL